MNIAIIGHGYVGKAVEYGFDTSGVNLTIVDPKYGTSVEKIRGKQRIDAAFVCVPTPYGKLGEIDASIVKQVVQELKYFNCLIVIKSTVTPDVIDEIFNMTHGVVYNPEFLTEKNALDDFVNPPMHVFGGERKYCEQVHKLYQHYSACKPAPHYIMSAKEASFVKYGVNSFLASKVLWFNQFREIVDKHDCKYNTIINAIGTDARIAASHTQVPGPDRKRGFGGACFPKDTNAFFKFAPEFSVLEEVIRVNNKYRSEYELDDREKEQNVTFD